jgi:hypothetical protein
MKAILTINVPVVFMARYVMVLSCPVLLLVMMLHSSKPLSISAIKTTGTLVDLCTLVLLYPSAVMYCCCVLLSVVVCCCVLLCVRGVGRSPCSCVV